MENSFDHMIDLLSPSTPSSSSVLAFIRNNAERLSREQLDGLLAKWGRRPFAHREASLQVDPLVMSLMEMGADPWRTEGLVSSWVGGEEAKWVQRAFVMVDRDAWPQLLRSEWLHDAVDRSSPMTSLLLSLGAQHLRRGKDGAFPLHLAKSPSIVSLLCASGADVSARDYQGKMPINAWLDPFSARCDARDCSLFSDRVLAMFRWQALHGDVSVVGLEAAPLLLAASGAWQEAATIGGLSLSGCEVVPCSGAPLGASPLTGWAYSVFQGVRRLEKLSAARDLIARCFAHRDGTWDHEWVLAAVAFTHVSASPACAGSAKSSLAADRIRELFARRFAELEGMPGMHGAGSRLDEAIRLSASLGGPFDWMGRLGGEVAQAVVRLLANGETSSIPGLGVDHMNRLVDAITPSSFGRVENLVASEWRKGIPEQFWQSQEGCRPEWMTRLKQEVFIDFAQAAMDAGRPLPEALNPQPSWPPYVLASIEAYRLSSRAPEPSLAPRRPRRM